MSLPTQEELLAGINKKFKSGIQLNYLEVNFLFENILKRLEKIEKKINLLDEQRDSWSGRER